MLKPASYPRNPTPTFAQRAVDAVLRLLATYMLPVGIGMFSLIALLSWPDHYAHDDGVALPLQVLTPDARLTPGQAVHLLSQRPPIDSFETRLSEQPLWFAFTPRVRAAGAGGGAGIGIEFPSRHATAIACWDAQTLQPLGDASRTGAHGAMKAVKAGFALNLGGATGQVLCRASFVGPARLTAVAWPAGQLELSIQDFHRKSGLLDGGMIVLTLFVLLTALINRQALYIQFAGWLILSLRAGALSGGWDIQWLGQVVPADWLLPMRAVTIALFALSSLTLYQTLFGAELARTRFGPFLRFSQWVCLPFLACALLLPYRVFLPIMWGVVAFGLGLMTLGLVAIMLRSRNRVAM